MKKSWRCLLVESLLSSRNPRDPSWLGFIAQRVAQISVIGDDGRGDDGDEN